MKTGNRLLRNLLLLTAFGWLGAMGLFAQESPVLRVDITNVNAGGVDFGTPNESYGQSNSAVTVTALAEGTFTASSFTYSFFVNGVSIGQSPGAVAPPATASASWVPPRPGVYYLTVAASDGVTTVTSPTVRFFATGATITSPLAGTLVPEGSSVTIKADATPQQAAIQKIEFFADGVLLGSDSTAPYSFVYTPTAAVGNSVNITAMATDGNGSTTGLTSSAVNLSIVSRIGSIPTVEVAAPGDNSIIAVPSAPIGITITANDSDGRIDRVEIYVDGVLFATDLAFPYTADWQPLAVGQYRISALAYDDKNNVVASPVSSISISAPPAVSINSPSNGVAISAGSTINVKASASDSDGTVSSVQFFASGEFIGEDFTAPYEIAWTPANADPDNPLTAITALATDNLGLSTVSASVSVSIQGSGGSGGGGVIGVEPTVSLTTPTNGASHRVNTPLTLAANASDADGNIQKVSFYANSTLIGTDATYPYTTGWTPTAVATFSLEARATDNDGNLVTSAPVSLAVTDPSGGSPSVVVSSPAAGSVVQVGTTATVIVAASDTDGSIASVELFLDGQVLGTSDTTSPYIFSWTPEAPGVFSLTARATDNAGNVTTSTAVAVNAADASSSPPTVSIISPTSTSSLVAGFSTNLIANALDSDGQIASVQFFVNGRNQGAPDTTEPFITAWVPSSSGSYSLHAVATDTSGNQTTGATVTVSVQANTAPTVSITSPFVGNILVVNAPTSLRATAVDSGPNGSVAAVEFFANGTSVGTDNVFPYALDWTPTAVGPVTLTAVVTDTGGNLGTSARVDVVVTGGVDPVVNLTSPTAGSGYVVGSPIALSASASAGAPASVASVIFIANGFPIATDAVAPFNGIWVPTSAGTYEVSARISDNLGNIATSSTVSITVANNTPPMVNLTSPSNGSSFGAGTPITFTANASDIDGSLTSVAFFASGVQIGTDTAAPFSITWTPSAASTYSITARATDNSGNVTQSDTLSVSVVGNTAPSVSLTSPGAGSTVLLGSSTALTASASDSDGTVAAVSFYANGVLIGTDAEAPYTMNWTPSAAGIYRLQVSASDSGSQTTTSTQVVVAVVDAAEVETDTVYSGTYIAGFEIGQFTIVRRGTVSATFIGKSNGANPTIYVYKDIAVDSAGNFSLVQSGQTVISGTFSDAGVNGQFDNNRAILIGVASFPSLTYTGPNGVIYGSLFSQNDSELLMIAAPDGKLTVLASSGGNRTVGFGAFGANNTFTVSTSDGGTITGTLDATTGFVQGFARGGAVSGTIRAALSSPAPAADGFLRNLSTRGYVGTGESILVAGFVVNGATPKQVLVRAIGPTLANYGVSGVVTDPTLKVYSGATVVASNDNWGTDAAVPGATATIGAFALPTGSADSALVTTLNPGPYTAQVSGVSGATGVGLVEIYDLDTQTPFSDDKMLNVATRGRVGAGDQALIAGVIVNGTTPKRVLIRAVGPTLSEFGIAGPLANPVLELVRQSDGSTVRQNDNWQRGNDAAGVVQASSEVGAFALPSGSLDAVLLITLPPGNYTALVTSGDNSSGIAIVEVYEVQ